MPAKQTRKKSVARRSPKSKLAVAQAELLEHFHRQIADSLGPLLGKAGVARVRRDLAVVSNVGGEVVVHAALRRKGAITMASIIKESPIVGVLANTLPLTDPVSGKEMKPGAYAVRLRSIGPDDVAFDFLTGKSEVAFSARAIPTKPGHIDPRTPIPVALDVDIIEPVPDDIPGLPAGWPGAFCISFLGWRHCWTWVWPVLWSH